MDTDPGSKRCLKVSRPLASVFREEGYYAKINARNLFQSTAGAANL